MQCHHPPLRRCRPEHTWISIVSCNIWEHRVSFILQPSGSPVIAVGNALGKRFSARVRIVLRMYNGQLTPFHCPSETTWYCSNVRDSIRKKMSPTRLVQLRGVVASSAPCQDARRGPRSHCPRRCLTDSAGRTDALAFISI